MLLHSKDLVISIHAPRVGSDIKMHILVGPVGHISIHAPRVGSDPFHLGWPRSLFDFNPRSPCGERLCNVKTDFFVRFNFNPRSPCGERLTR